MVNTITNYLFLGTIWASYGIHIVRNKVVQNRLVWDTLPHGRRQTPSSHGIDWEVWRFVMEVSSHSWHPMQGEQGRMWEKVLKQQESPSNLVWHRTGFKLSSCWTACHFVLSLMSLSSFQKSQYSLTTTKRNQRTNIAVSKSNKHK